MTTKEHAERRKLHDLWMYQCATKKQILRCMELDRKAETEVSEILTEHFEEEHAGLHIEK